MTRADPVTLKYRRRPCKASTRKERVENLGISLSHIKLLNYENNYKPRVLVVYEGRRDLNFNLRDKVYDLFKLK